MIPTTTVSDSRPPSPVVVAIPRQRRMPVGARFPRTWPEITIVEAVPVAGTEPRPASVFPAGCRFPRRTAADVRAYLAAAPFLAVSVADHTSRPPVGARFPLPPATHRDPERRQAGSRRCAPDLTPSSRRHGRGPVESPSAEVAVPGISAARQGQQPHARAQASDRPHPPLRWRTRLILVAQISTFRVGRVGSAPHPPGLAAAPLPPRRRPSCCPRSLTLSTSR